MTLVRALVTLHGGTSAITSEEGIGTEVTVSFPLPVPEEAQDPSVEAVDTMERIVA